MVLLKSKMNFAFSKIKAENALLFLIITLGVILRIIPVPELTRGSISYNAGLTLSAASGLNFDLVGPDQAPLRYVLLHYLFFLGRSEFILRLPALLFGIAAILIIFQLGKAVFNSKVGLLSSFFLATSLWHIHHSTYEEMYTLYAFLSSLSLYFFYQSLVRRDLRYHILFVLVSVLAFYSFYPLITVAFAEFIWLLLFYRHYREALPRCLVSFVIALVLIIPGLFNAYKGFLWKSNFGDYHWGWKLQEILPSFLAVFGGIREGPPINIFIFLSGLLIIFNKKAQKDKALLLFLLFTVPCLLLIGAIFFQINVVERYFLFVYPFFIILSSYGIWRLKNKALIFIFILLFSTPAAMFLFSRYGGRDLSRFIPGDYLWRCADFKFVAGYLEKNYQPLDAVVIEQGPGILAAQYYLDMDNLFPVKKVFPSCGALDYYRYDGLKVKNFFGLVEYDENPERLHKIYMDYPRLWLIDLNHMHHADKNGLIREWINKYSSQEIKFRGGSIYLFEGGKLKDGALTVVSYKCSAKVCYLGCAGPAIKILYPFNRVAGLKR